MYLSICIYIYIYIYIHIYIYIYIYIHKYIRASCRTLKGACTWEYMMRVCRGWGGLASCEIVARCDDPHRASLLP